MKWSVGFSVAIMYLVGMDHPEANFNLKIVVSKNRFLPIWACSLDWSLPTTADLNIGNFVLKLFTFRSYIISISLHYMSLIFKSTSFHRDHHLQCISFIIKPWAGYEERRTAATHIWKEERSQRIPQFEGK